MLSQTLRTRWASLTTRHEECTSTGYVLSHGTLAHYVPLGQSRAEKPGEGWKLLPLPGLGTQTHLSNHERWGEKPQVLGRLCAGAENTGDLGGVLFYNFQLSHITFQHLSIPICNWRLLVPTQSFSEAGPKNKATPYQMLMHVVIHKNVLWFTKHCTKINYWWQIIVVYNHK